MPPPAPASRLDQALNRGLDGLFGTLAHIGQVTAAVEARRAKLRVERDVPYGPHAWARLDLYWPARAQPRGVVVYFHGGGFRILSKESHASFGTRFARAGYLAVLPEYRLAPAHRLPAAVDDAFEAHAWVQRELRAVGLPVLAGESAGANLALNLALGREGAGAARALVLGCGLYRVSRLDRPGAMRRHERARLERVRDDCLGVPPEAVPEADPLDRVLERRDLSSVPPVFLGCGTRDVLLHDSRALCEALTARGARAQLEVYDGGVHAFQALPWLRITQRFWADVFAFLRRVEGASA